MDENLLEILEFKGLGYQPLIDFATWRVAILRFIDELIPNRIEKMERHTATDEVFVLLSGRAVLFIGQGNAELTGLTPWVMEPGKLYNVKCNTWHSVVLSFDASILLVENQDTGPSNTDYAPVGTALRRSILEISIQEQPDCWKDLE